MGCTGWLFTLTSATVFRERGRDTSYVSDEARNKIHTIRFARARLASIQSLDSHLPLCIHSAAV